ncbi:IS232 putative ATP-binding protein IstB [Malacoplasma penetrans HF-2]|uniref:IS232 putative ATP-binding protein IstB n=1 Tax=Malacoplasma penetrans (strain HF-2) TaxID=272633 RepID=Q8EVL4_MALP2|nr:IS21-like element helper ATPase IstB [Malacoplasma penetrans]BAC44339.1 IS232 putative ATP-binding protein IstB [Malacoplasma penetrans HF-2]
MKEIENLLNEVKWTTNEKVFNLLMDQRYSSPLIVEFLKSILREEVNFKTKRRKYLKVKTGGFGIIKTIEEFDFTFQPQINQNQINYFLNFDFIKNKQNIIFQDTSGVGKTHLATAIGIAAAESKYSVYFIDCNRLLNNLQEAKFKNQLAQRIKHYSKYKLLIIDELGFLPMDQEKANIFFQLVNSRYLKSSTIITTNKLFSEWGKLFQDEVIASAILDILLHKSHVVSIAGKSYRNYESLKLKEEIEWKDNVK